jgi:hypothetical protein
MIYGPPEKIKEARSLRRFLSRGLKKVDAEWHLIIDSAQHRTPESAVDSLRKCRSGPGEVAPWATDS